MARKKTKPPIEYTMVTVTVQEKISYRSEKEYQKKLDHLLGQLEVICTYVDLTDEEFDARDPRDDE